VRNRSAFGRFLRPALIAAAVSGMALFFGATQLPGDGTNGVSAEEILQRANVASAQAASDSLPYHLRATTTINDEKAGRGTFPTETWYAGESQFRVENAGPLGLTDGQTRNGDDFWIFLTDVSGQLRVAHGPASALDIKFNGRNLPSSTSSLSEMLAQYSQPCMKASLEGETRVLSRDAYVIRVDFDPSSCGKDFKDLAKSGRKDSTRITVDQQLFLPLVSERLNESGSVMYRYEVTQLDLNPSFEASTFAFQAPPGAVVIEVASMLEAKMALAGVQDAPKFPAGDVAPDCKVVETPTERKELNKVVECPVRKP